MSFSDRYAKTFRQLLPAPFTIALILTLTAFLLAVAFGDSEVYASSKHNRILTTIEMWYNGLWSGPGMQFAMQMMLMLLLGHVMALSRPVDRFLTKLSLWCPNNAQAALILTFSTILVSLFNWGLGLVFGALFARKIAESAVLLGQTINYGFIGACGYVGLMVWHGGISGSAPIKVADPGHLEQLMQGSTYASKVPNTIPLSETIFSGMNITATLLVIVLLPLFMYFVGKRIKSHPFQLQILATTSATSEEPVGMEKVDQSKWIGLVFGTLLLLYVCFRIYHTEAILTFGFLTPDFINFSLLGLCLILHRSFQSFLAAIESAIGGVSGILLQFPLYFGIMAIMKESGLMSSAAEWIGAFASPSSFPMLTFSSSGIMNILVPSGGGQWVVQGPVIIETALQNNIPLHKCVMAMAYGDQLTNMMQPFWALPLLGITGLKAKEILPYTLLLMLAGILIFSMVLLLF